MHLVLVSPLWPHPSHTVRAANVVFFEMLSALAASADVKVTLLKVTNAGEPSPTEDERAGADLLREQGVAIAELPLPPSPAPRVRGRWDPRVEVEDWYPIVAHRGLGRKTVEDLGADALLIPWSEPCVMLFAGCGTPTFGYYGNPDSNVLRARVRLGWRAQRKAAAFAKGLAQATWLERVHLREMAKLELLGDVAANDAAWYREKGLKDAFYIRNLWIDRRPDSWQAGRAAAAGSTTVIGNLGKLTGTANTYGMAYLGEEVLPALAERMGSAAYHVDILGSGEPHPMVAPGLRRPEVHLRGFVPDVDDELLESAVFLCVNNGTAFNVGHTRYLHAWSLGCCVVGHRATSLAMPEIVHGENALLGRDASEIADLVAAAIEDPGLRATIGEAGYETFRELFTAVPVATEILRRVDGVLSETGVTRHG